MNLHIKYRPSKFTEVVGNEYIIEYLKATLQDVKKHPSAFLFHGERGLGKTTLARIVAKELDCRGLDLTEMNVANLRGIDTSRDIIKSANFSPVESGSKVWIIDEAHKLTGDAQNALLKLLEEPPKHCYFILCTTEPNKLIKTVRDRCISLRVNPLSDSEMFSVLKRIVKKEGKELKKVVYDQIIQHSLGLVRNAIQLLDVVLNLPKKQQLKAAKKSAEEQSQSIELCRALLKGSPWSLTKNILKGLKDQEAESIRRHILGYAQAVLLNKEDNRAAFMIEELRDPLYDIGFPGLVLACYTIIKG